MRGAGGPWSHSLTLWQFQFMRAPLTLRRCPAAGWNADVRPFDAQRSAIGDRRYLGGFDARFHSTSQ